MEVAGEQECARYICDVAALLPATFTGCYGDVDGNGFVNAGDRGFISASIGLRTAHAVCRFDLDGNGHINPADRGFVSAAMGECPPLPDFQNGSGQNAGSADLRFPSPTFNAGLTCDDVICPSQSCADWGEDDWEGGFDGIVYSLVPFDDGQGPALYAGGAFTSVEGVPVNRIAVKRNGWNWSPLGAVGGLGLNGTVRTLAIFDDGSGPALFAGGEFVMAEGVVVNHIAKWNGVSWVALPGPTTAGTDGHVLALAVFDDGSGQALFVGGSFTNAGGLVVNRMAKWDGSTWSPLVGPAGNGMNSSVYALTVFDQGAGPALYAGGIFTTAGGAAAQRVARWNGTAWSSLSGPAANGTNADVYALTVFDDGAGAALYAAGEFNFAGGLSASKIAKWNGAQWSSLTSPLGSTLNGAVRTIRAFDDGSGNSLYVGGDFSIAGGVESQRIARWNGASWSRLPGQLPNELGRQLYAVHSLAALQDEFSATLHVAGYFGQSVQGSAHSIVASWSEDGWSPRPRIGVTGITGSDGGINQASVDTMAVFDDGAGVALYAGGSFTRAGGRVAHGLAKWNGTEWHPLEGQNGGPWQASALAVFDDGGGPALYAGANSCIGNPAIAACVSKWDGTQWSPLTGPNGGGIENWVKALVVFDDGSGPALYAGGLFTTADGIQVNGVASWNGSAWSPLVGPHGTGVAGNAVDSVADVFALTVFDDGSGPALYVGGRFGTAGGVEANYIARWDGSTWSPLVGASGGGPNNWVSTLVVFDDGSGPALYAGGSFSAVGSIPAGRIAKWNGANWSVLEGSGGVGVGCDGCGAPPAVQALAVFDDGGGAALIVGGYFSIAGGIDAHSIAKWNGAAWSALASDGEDGIGYGTQVLSMVVLDDADHPGLYVGGRMATAGGAPSNSIARWGCAP